MVRFQYFCKKLLIPLKFLKTMLYTFSYFHYFLSCSILGKVPINILPKQRKILNQQTKTVITIISTMFLTRTQMIKACMTMHSIFLKHTQSSKWTKKMENPRPINVYRSYVEVTDVGYEGFVLDNQKYSMNIINDAIHQHFKNDIGYLHTSSVKFVLDFCFCKIIYAS